MAGRRIRVCLQPAPYGTIRTLDRGGTPADAHAIDPEQDQRADDGQDEAPQRETREADAGDHTANPSADEGANDSDDHRYDYSARVGPRRNGLCDGTCQQAEYDPGNDAHTTSDVVERRHISSWQPPYHNCARLD